MALESPSALIEAPGAALGVRRLNQGEDMLLRSLRLDALHDSPDQLGEALTEAAARSDQDWAALTASLVAPSSQAAYIAELSDSAIGMVFALKDRTDESLGRLGGIWVLPAARGRGVGGALAHAVLGWWRAAGKRAVQLWVVPGGAAERLYRRVGFLPTGASKPFPGAEARCVIEMQLDLVLES